MRNHRSAIIVSLTLAFVFCLAPLKAPAQIYVGIGAPPPIPYYTQPAVSIANDIWQPGYWAWGPAGYYWVPGTWVAPPNPGLYWTPGFWNWISNGYQWNPGYWGQNVGYYGGVNYGFGYYGNGYVGGAWNGEIFRYNTAVTTVNRTIIHNVYVNRTVIVRNVVRTSYNGGPGGLRVRPTPVQLRTVAAHPVPMTAVQREHVNEAQANRSFLTTVNHGTPPRPAVPHPMTHVNRPPDFHPVTPADRAAVPHPHPQPAPAHNAPPPHNQPH